MRSGMFGHVRFGSGLGLRGVAGVVMDNFLHGMFKVQGEAVGEDELDFPVCDGEVATRFLANLLEPGSKRGVMIAVGASY